MENEKGWLKCVMWTGSSWGTWSAVPEKRGADVGVFVSIEHKLKGRKADQEWNARVEKWYTIASEDPRRTQDMESKNIYFRRNDCCQKKVASVVDTTGS